MPKAAAATSNRPLPTETEAASPPVPYPHNLRDPRINNFPSAGTNLLPSAGMKLLRGTGISLIRRTGADRATGTGIRVLRGRGMRRLCGKGINRLRQRAERGAVTAEYAIMIVGACAIGGVLVALLRSPAMQNALKAIINYGLKIAGVEGVHI
jgi:hypothetical protein